MKNINITNARQNLYQLVSEVNAEYNPINIINNRGKNAVLISESDWHDIEETIYLNFIPGYVDKIKQSLKEDKSKYNTYKQGEKW